MAFDADELEALQAARGGPAPVRFDWSAARVALLRQRWAAGLSASSIAKELGSGVSRCAVLGKVHRLRLAQPEFRRQHPRKERARKRPRAPRPVARPRGRSPSQLMEMLCALGLDAVFGAPDTRTVHRHAGRAFGPGCGLLDLTAATCRWPVGEPGEERAGRGLRASRGPWPSLRAARAAGNAPHKLRSENSEGNTMGRAWLPLYVGDYLRDTRDLNTLQHGAYLLLIMH